MPAIPTSSVPNPKGAPCTRRASAGTTPIGTGKGSDTITSGLEGAWTNEPTKWDNGYLDNLFKYEWDLTRSPAGAQQWVPTDPAAADSVPDAHDPSKRHAPIMLTTDLALRMDPIYAPIAKRFHENPDELADAFARAWYKLLHRDMGPVQRYLGPWVPPAQLWQDPVPAVDHELVSDADVADLKAKILASGLSVSELVFTAWAAAACFRGTDKRGGANGARLRLAPQKDWAVNNPAEVAKVIQVLEGIQKESAKKVSLADLIVLGGCAAVEQAAKNGGVEHHRAVRAGTHRCDAGDDRRRVVRGARADLRWLPQPPPPRREAVAGDAAARPGQLADAHRSRDDGARWRHARPRTRTPGTPRTASSPTVPAR